MPQKIVHSECLTILVVIIATALVLFLAIWIRHLYIQWKEDREFWRQFDNMVERKNKKFIQAFEKLIEDINNTQTL
jgi:uncharacterized membrane protein